ncbi:MAG: hypothetical protein CL946_01085 [Ectothiorhodospiraceae bacterium]|nr:hypothetical protein [Ectothiorhodospiraceae bacterium]
MKTAMHVVSTIVVCLAMMSIQGFAQNEHVQQDGPVRFITRPTTKDLDTKEIPIINTERWARPFNCTSRIYYDQSASTTEYTDSVPSKVFAVRASMPSGSVQHPVSRCTVWTVDVDFYWLPDSANDRDTINVFIRQANSPYNEIHISKFLTTLGNNVGNIEIDPPILPYTVPIIANTSQDYYIGIYITGDTGNTIKWRFRTPAAYSSPPRSYVFTSRTSPVPVGTALSLPDWKFYPTVCCDFGVPVELSLFHGSYLDGAVFLNWQTESEINNYGFEILRSGERNGEYYKVGEKAGKGTTHERSWYDFVDNSAKGNSPTGSYFYKLRQIDFDGEHKEYGPIRVALGAPGEGGFHLHSAYPNPVSQDGYSVIGYELPEESDVSIRVVNALGQEVATLLEGEKPAGYHEALWQVNSQSGLLHGTYFIMMQAGTHSAVKKISVLK